MERLVLGLIAVIGLHTAFVVYMAGIKRVDQNTEMARGEVPARMPSRQNSPKPAIQPQLEESAEPPASKTAPINRGLKEIGRNVHSRTPRAGLIDSPQFTTSRRPSRISSVAKTIPAFPARPRSKNIELTFSDRVILYKAPAKTQARQVAAAPAVGDPSNRRRRNNSLVAKLQWVYKKPWGLMKAVGSKLR